MQKLHAGVHHFQSSSDESKQQRILHSPEYRSHQRQPTIAKVEDSMPSNEAKSPGKCIIAQ